MNPQAVGFSDKYHTDRIVGVYTGSFDASAAPTLGGNKYYAIPHDFGQPVFLHLAYSTDDIAYNDGGGSSLAIPYSTATENRILTAILSGTVYYRLVAFWINNYDATNPLVAPTRGSKSDTFFDTKLNYQKVFVQDTLTAPAGMGSTRDIEHGLGYIPNVRVFNEMVPGQVWPANFGGTKNYWLTDLDDVECIFGADTDKLTIEVAGGVTSPSSRIWYIIYYD